MAKRVEFIKPLPSIYPNANLIIATSGSRGNISTRASIVKIERCAGFTTRTFELFGDFNESVVTSRVKRVSQKMINEQHLVALRSAEDIEQRAITFYAEKDTSDAL